MLPLDVFESPILRPSKKGIQFLSDLRVLSVLLPKFLNFTTGCRRFGPWGGLKGKTENMFVLSPESMLKMITGSEWYSPSL